MKKWQKAWIRLKKVEIEADQLWMDAIAEIKQKWIWLIQVNILEHWTIRILQLIELLIFCVRGLPLEWDGMLQKRTWKVEENFD